MFGPRGAAAVPGAGSGGDSVSGFVLLMVGGLLGSSTVKFTPGLPTPPEAITTKFPVLAPLGTIAVMLPELQFEMVAGMPLKMTPPLP
jgi:hypothetical protein